MSILSDLEIIELSKKGMIEPFEEMQIRVANENKVVSYGVSSYGYDMRVANEFKIITSSLYMDNFVIDPKKYDERLYTTVIGDSCIIPPNNYVLARSVEYFRIPRDVTVICVGKSTYARCGIIVNVTPLESSWEGIVTISISNTSPMPVKIYANEGIAQLLFLKADSICKTSYADKSGKYQNQQGIVGAKV